MFSQWNGDAPKRQDVDPQEITAAVQQAALDARDPTLRQRLNAAAAIFAALSRRDEREREAWAIVRDVAKAEGWYGDCVGNTHCVFGCVMHDFDHALDCPVTKARALLAGQ